MKIVKLAKDDDYDKMLDWFEKRSFENLVHLYDNELHKIQSQNIVGGVLDERELSKLLREGVLKIEEYGRMGKPTLYHLSDEALRILKGITENAESRDSIL